MTTNEPDAPATAATIPGPPQPNSEQMFPALTSAQIARLSAIGRERRLADSEMLWEAGATEMPFYVVLEGAIAILGGRSEELVVVHEAGGFTGDVDMLSGRRAAVRARARGDYPAARDRPPRVPARWSRPTSSSARSSCARSSCAASR